MVRVWLLRLSGNDARQNDSPKKPNDQHGPECGRGVANRQPVLQVHAEDGAERCDWKEDGCEQIEPMCGDGHFITAARLLFALAGHGKIKTILGIAVNQFSTTLNLDRVIAQYDEVTIFGCQLASLLQSRMHMACSAKQRRDVLQDAKVIVGGRSLVESFAEPSHRVGIFGQMFLDGLESTAQRVRLPAALGLAPEEPAVSSRHAGLRRLVQHDQQVSVGHHGALAAGVFAQPRTKDVRNLPGGGYDGFGGGGIH